MMDPFLLNPHDEKFFRHLPPINLPKLQKNNYAIPAGGGHRKAPEFLPMEKLLARWDQPGAATQSDDHDADVGDAPRQDDEDLEARHPQPPSDPVSHTLTAEHLATAPPSSRSLFDDLPLVVLGLVAIALCLYIFLYNPTKASPDVAPLLLDDSDIVPIV